MKNGYEFKINTNEENLRHRQWNLIQKYAQALFEENGVNVPRVCIRSVKESNIISMETKKKDLEIIVEVFLVKKWYERISKEKLNDFKSFVTTALCLKDETQIKIAASTF